MSYPAKKTFTNPIWVLFVGLFVLAGCQVDGTLNVEEEDSQTAQQEESSLDDTQETASQPGSEDSLAGTPEEPSTGDEPVDETVDETTDGTTDETTTDTGGSTPVVDTAATLMWDAPSSRENGDDFPRTEVDNYIVSWGQNPDSLAYSEVVECANCGSMEHVIQDLDEGTWYFTVQTRDFDGNVSRQADLATKEI